jgi:hypothetical protein
MLIRVGNSLKMVVLLQCTEEFCDISGIPSLIFDWKCKKDTEMLGGL